MILPDPPPPARIAHIDWSYSYRVRDERGSWLCYVPLRTRRVCVLVRVQALV